MNYYGLLLLTVSCSLLALNFHTAESGGSSESSYEDFINPWQDNTYEDFINPWQDNTYEDFINSWQDNTYEDFINPRQDNTYEDFGIKLFRRREWNARRPVETWSLPANRRFLIIHHTSNGYCETPAVCKEKAKYFQKYHQEKVKWPDIAYTFLIGGDGNVYEGVGWHKRGTHTFNYNCDGHAIAFIGNYSQRAPSAKVLNAAKNLINYGISKGYLSQSYILLGHKDTNSGTDCPGDKLYDKIKHWDHFQGGSLTPSPTPCPTPTPTPTG